MPIKRILPRKKPLRLKKSEQNSRKHAPRFARSSSNCGRPTAGSSTCNGGQCSDAAVQAVGVEMFQPPALAPDRTPGEQPSEP